MSDSEVKTGAFTFGFETLPHLLQIKSNHFYCHITTAQVPWWVKFLWACSRQCRKTTDNLPMDRQCKKTTTTIYIWTDSAKKQQQTIYIWTDSAKNCTGAFTVLQTVQKNNNNNLHMDSTYLQTVQKTMCKIHIHILSTHSVLQRHNYQRHIIHRMGTSALCTVSIHNVVYA